MSHRLFSFRYSGDPRLLEGEIGLRTVRIGALFCAVAAIGFAGLYAWRGPAEFALPHVLAAAILAVIAYLPTRTGTTPLYLAVTVGLLLFGYQLILLGRIDNGVVVWFLVPFSAAMILGMHKVAIYSGAVAAIEIVGVVVSVRMGWLQGRVAFPESDLVMAVSVLSVMTLVGLFAFIAQRARRRLLHELEMRNANLAAVNKELNPSPIRYRTTCARRCAASMASHTCSPRNTAEHSMRRERTTWNGCAPRRSAWAR